MKVILALTLLPLLLIGCSTSKTALSSDGKKVRILSSTKESGCNVVDKVVGENEKGSLPLAKNHARNLAAKVDGNAIFFDEIVQNGAVYKVYATAFECE